jgi:hypothetical protein
MMPTACGSPPTAPSSRFPDAAPPAAVSASAASLTIADGALSFASWIPATLMLKGRDGFQFGGRVKAWPPAQPLPRTNLLLPCRGNGTVTFTLPSQPFLNGWGITCTSFDVGDSGGPE